MRTLVTRPANSRTRKLQPMKCCRCRCSRRLRKPRSNRWSRPCGRSSRARPACRARSRQSAEPEMVNGRLLIFPCNGNGLEALDCLGTDWQLLGFVDDTPEKQASGAYGHRVMPRAALADSADAAVLAVPGGPLSYQARRKVIEG